MANLNNTDSTSADQAAAAWFRKNLELVEAELLAVVQKHTARVGRQIICHALIELTGSVCAAVVEAEPAARAALAAKLADLRLYVSTTGQRPQ